MPTYEPYNTFTKQSKQIEELSSALEKALELNRTYLKEIACLKVSLENLKNCCALVDIKTFGNWLVSLLKYSSCMDSAKPTYEELVLIIDKLTKENERLQYLLDSVPDEPSVESFVL